MQLFLRRAAVHFHNRAFAEAFFNLGEGGFERGGFVGWFIGVFVGFLFCHDWILLLYRVLTGADYRIVFRLPEMGLCGDAAFASLFYFLHRLSLV